MKTVVGIMENAHGVVVGAVTSTGEPVELSPQDYFPRAELASRAGSICSKYGLTPSTALAAALAKVTVPIPD